MRVVAFAPEDLPPENQVASREIRVANLLAGTPVQRDSHEPLPLGRLLARHLSPNQRGRTPNESKPAHFSHPRMQGISRVQVPLRSGSSGRSQWARDLLERQEF